jgi:hypothetical protein
MNSITLSMEYAQWRLVPQLAVIIHIAPPMLAEIVPVVKVEHLSTQMVYAGRLQALPQDHLQLPILSVIYGHLVIVLAAIMVTI